MTQEHITRFAKRLNVVLRAAGWPAAPYVGGPDPFLLNQPYSDATISRDRPHPLGAVRFVLTLKRSDHRSSVVVVEAAIDRPLTDPIPHVRVLNALVRRTKWALA